MTRMKLFGITVMALGIAAFSAAAEEAYQVEWSATLLLEATAVADQESKDGVTGFFDQYRATANQDVGFPVELGLSDFSLDVLGESETPVLQMRLRSPTSNLGISGEDIADPFLNQRAELAWRPHGASLDLRYRRGLVEELRLFRNGSGIGTKTGSLFNDDTDPMDRFGVRRTGYNARLRLRPHEILGFHEGTLAWLAPQLTFHQGSDWRDGQRQLRFMLGGSDRVNGNNLVRWRARSMEIEQTADDIGAGLLFAPGGLFTLSFDFDHQRFRDGAVPLTNRNLWAGGAVPDIAGDPARDGDKNLRTTGFIPDSDRTTGSVRIHSRLGDRAVVTGGIQVSSLEQVGESTPLAELAGLERNSVLFYSGNLALRAKLWPGASAKTYVRFNTRRNRIQRDTSVFTPTSTSQIDPLLKRLRKIDTGVELSQRFMGRNRVAVGYRGSFVDRVLDFSTSTGDQVRSENALVAKKSEVHTVYARAQLRPLAGLRVGGEVGYRNAPETGYIRELDNVVYGEARASYTLSLSSPITLSAYVRGESGQNRDFTMVGATAGTRERDFDSDRFAYGVTVSAAPTDSLSLFASFYRDDQDEDFALIRSDQLKFKSVVNYFQDADLDYRSDLWTVSVGGTSTLWERTDARLAYSFTRSESSFLGNSLTASTIQSGSEIDSDIHSVDVGFGSWLSEGMQVSLGYRFDKYKDNGPLAAAPFDPSTHQHTVTLGLTLTSDLFD